LLGSTAVTITIPDRRRSKTWRSQKWGTDGRTCFSLYILVGGAITILKNMKVDGKDYPISEMENKTCLKPPTSILYIYIHIYIIV
jgi:hypothetical protein